MELFTDEAFQPAFPVIQAFKLSQQKTRGKKTKENNLDKWVGPHSRFVYDVLFAFLKKKVGFELGQKRHM